MAYFIAELDERAQTDIRKRFEALKGCFDLFTDEDIDKALDDKVNIVVPNLEWQEYLYFDLSLEWIDDVDFIRTLLNKLDEWQRERRKSFGYDY